MSDETINARLEKTTENNTVYGSAEPEEAADAFTQSLTGFYVNKAAFDGEPPEFITVDLDGAIELNREKNTANYGYYTHPAAVNGLYVAHHNFDSDEAPEDLAINISPTSASDFADSEEAVEEEWSQEAMADDEDLNALVQDGDDDSETSEASDEEEEEELSEEEEELAELVEEAA